MGALVSYVVALILDWLIFRPTREVIETSNLIAIDRPGGLAEILGYYGLAALAVLLIWWAVGRVQPPWSSLWKFLAALLVVSLFLGFGAPVLVPEVQPRSEISGQASDPQLSYYLFVRPVGSPGCWLQEPIPLVVGSDGAWRTEAAFGGSTGQRYEILVVGSEEPLHPEPFHQPGRYLCRDIPAESHRSALLVERG